MVSVYNYTNHTDNTLSPIRQKIKIITSIEMIINNFGAENIITMLNQDEFTIDVVVKYADYYLVFDTT